MTNEEAEKIMKKMKEIKKDLKSMAVHLSGKHSPEFREIRVAFDTHRQDLERLEWTMKNLRGVLD